MSETFKPPYSASWVDRVIDSIDRLPMPNWLFYILLTIAELIIYQLINWLAGAMPFGSFDTLYSYAVLYNIISIAFIDYMRHVAARAFDDFSLALGLPEAESNRLKYQLTVLPALPALIATLIGAAFAIITTATYTQPPSANSVPFGPSAYIIGTIGFACTGPLILQIFRQLMMVTRIHRQAQRINLFQYSPLYAFSSLTVRIGLLGIGGAYFNLASDPTVFNNLPLLIFNLGLLGLSLAAFVLPLNGMHQCIVREKKRLLSEADQRFESVIVELNQHIDSRNLDQVDTLTRTMTSLVTQRDIISKIPTWPWRVGTFGGFATTLLLPIIIWLITRLLTRAGL